MNDAALLVPDTPAARLLADAGERLTAARGQVLDILLAAPCALSHHEIAAAARKAGADLDRVTLYRVLDWLVDKGLAHKIAGEDRIWRFNALAGEHPGAGRARQHAHFQCRRCGRLFCLNELKPVFAFNLPAGFRCDDAELTLHGACPDCANSSN